MAEEARIQKGLAFKQEQLHAGLRRFSAMEQAAHDRAKVKELERTGGSPPPKTDPKATPTPKETQEEEERKRGEAAFKNKPAGDNSELIKRELKRRAETPPGGGEPTTSVSGRTTPVARARSFKDAGTHGDPADLGSRPTVATGPVATTPVTKPIRPRKAQRRWRS